MSLHADEFLRRFLLHLLPRGFVRIRNFGFIANRSRARLLPICFQLLRGSAVHALSPTREHRSSSWRCPACGGTRLPIFSYALRHRSRSVPLQIQPKDLRAAILLRKSELATTSQMDRFSPSLDRNFRISDKSSGALKLASALVDKSDSACGVLALRRFTGLVFLLYSHAMAAKS